VFRYDPEVEGKREPRFDDFHVPFFKGMTVLDALIYARDTYDSSLTFRHSCRQAVCGSDAVHQRSPAAGLSDPGRRPGRRDHSRRTAPHQDVVKDLVVDMEHFYDQMDAVEPYFDADELPDDEMEQQRQSPENHEKVKLSTRCIWCGACMSSCNIAADDNQYLGPAAINMAYRFAMDEREGGSARKTGSRSSSRNTASGAARPSSPVPKCVERHPAHRAFQELKREAVKSNLKFW